eukprot:15304829-Alexandrium_andersonii.AAC.1
MPRVPVSSRALTQPQRSQWVIASSRKDASETSLAVLVLKDRDSRTILAHPVLRKGRSHED